MALNTVTPNNPTRQEHESLTGVLERIVYFNEENHYCIGELKIHKQPEPITVAGTLTNVQCGETLLLKGSWIHHPQYGKQFKPVSVESKLPSSVYGIRKYLGSGLVQGIGKTYAEKIVDFFGEDTLKIISEQSAKLKEVPGIGKQRAKAIKVAWDEQQSVRDVMMFLQTYGIGSSQCLRLVKKYGNLAKDILQTQPYKIAQEIHGIGFKTADKIALNLGFANDSPARLDAGILFALSEFESNGHTACLKETLEQKAIEILQADAVKIGFRMKVLVEDGHLIEVDGNLLQLPILNKAETTIAQQIVKLKESESLLGPIITQKAVQWAQTKAGFEFAPEQAQGVTTALEEKLTIITGGPGTGKTTLLKALVHILKAKNIRILLAAPTGRAAQRMTEASGLQALTIHRLLKFSHETKKFTYNETTPLAIDFLIIDEASMIDTRLATSLFKAIPNSAHILLVGDVHQLPSVGSGKILNDLIHCTLFKTIELKQIFRQSKRSNIVSTAHSILDGKIVLPPSKKSLDAILPQEDLHFVQALSPEDAIDKIKLLCSRYLPKWYGHLSSQSVQLLAPLHRGIAGISNINVELQKELNTNTQKLITHSNLYKLGDKVIQMRNNYDKGIFNGDFGTITAIHHEAASMEVTFDCGKIELDRAETSDLQLAYAISIHKSQGSEFPIVIIPLLKQHFIMLQRNLIYTAITRGRRKVFLVGEASAYAMAVNNKESTFRQTDLQRKIISTC